MGIQITGFLYRSQMDKYSHTGVCPTPNTKLDEKENIASTHS